MDSINKINIRQVRSQSGHHRNTLRTLLALGLGSIGKQRTHIVNPAIIGMIKKVESLVKVYKVD